ncbi:MAG: hypothetical protein J6A61_01425 [Clostridia bacterium]|nr:hypothetical protein [Clostridia bacterium]
MSRWFGIALFVLFLCFPKVAANGISMGLEKGLLVLMPAIFPYMVVSQTVIKTGGARFLSSLFPGKQNKIAELLVPSLFCGYPTGARMASTAYDNNEITKRELYLMYGFGNIPGFGFSVAYLGGVLYQSIRLGVQIYLSFLCASLVLIGITMKTKKTTNRFPLPSAERALPFSSALVESVTESSMAIVSLICFVCFFSSLICFLQTFLSDSPLCAALCTMLEITSGLPLLLKYFPLSFAIFFTGFSGICVLFQSLFFDRKNAVNLLWLFLLRSIYGIVSVGCFYGLRLLSC